MKGKGRLATLIALAVLALACFGALVGCGGKENRHTVTFDLAYEGAPAATTATVQDGAAVKAPSDPTRAGDFVFLGWYEKDGDEYKADAYDFASPVTADLTLYAKWRAAEYFTVTFDPNGADLQAQTKSVKEGTAVSAPTEPERENFEFLGWFEKSNGTDLDAEAYDFTKIVAKDFTLYAKWVRLWNVTLVYDDGATENKVSTVRDGTAFAEPDPEPSRTNYEFLGWYEKDGGEYKAEAYDFTANVTADVTLYAKWVRLWNVTLVYGDGATENEVSTVRDGTAFAEPATPVYGGHGFRGWFEKSNGTDFDAEPYDFTENVTADVTLYAKWKIEQAAPDAISVGAAPDFTVSVTGSGETAAEYSADGETWNETFTVTYATWYTIYARFGENDEYCASEPAVLRYGAPANEANVSVEATPSAYESVTVSVTGHDAAFEYSTDGENWTAETVFGGLSPFEETVTVHVRLQGAEAGDEAEEVTKTGNIPHRADKDIPELFTYAMGLAKDLHEPDENLPKSALNLSTDEANGIKDGGSSENSVRIDLKYFAGHSNYETFLIRTSKNAIKVDLILYALNGDGTVDASSDGSATVSGHSDEMNIAYGSIPFKQWVTVYLPNSAGIMSGSEPSYSYAAVQIVVDRDTAVFFENVTALDEDEMPRYIRHKDMAKSWVEHGWATATDTRTFANNAIPENMNGDNEISYVLTSIAGTSNNYLHKPQTSDWGIKLDVKLAEGIAEINGTGAAWGVPTQGVWTTLYFPTSPAAASGGEYDHHADHVNTCCLFQVVAKSNVTIYIDNIQACTEAEYNEAREAYTAERPSEKALFETGWASSARTFADNTLPEGLHGDNKSSVLYSAPADCTSNNYVRKPNGAADWGVKVDVYVKTGEVEIRYQGNGSWGTIEVGQWTTVYLPTTPSDESEHANTCCILQIIGKGAVEIYLDNIQACTEGEFNAAKAALGA